MARLQFLSYDEDKACKRNGYDKGVMPMTPEEQELVDESFGSIDLKSKDFVADRIEQVKRIFPEVVTEIVTGGGRLICH